MDTFVDSLSSTETLTQSSACFTQDLSATFWQDPAHSTLQSLLSSLRQANADLKEQRESIPTHPWERLKHHYCHKDMEPLDFHNINIPDNFSYKESHKMLLDIASSYRNNFSEHLNFTDLSSIQLHEHPHFGNAFASLSGETFVLDKDKITNHIQLLDSIRGVSLDYIVANPKEFAQKVVSKFIEIHQ